MEEINLEDLRIQIDKVDRELIKLLAERFELTEQVGVYKAKKNLNPQDKSREAKQFEKLEKLSLENGLNPEYAQKIFRCVMDIAISRHLEIGK
ncbi:chorismate mutase [Bacillus tuaregi]|uniref:chorismate mutase n=1 Tax=Bacillus tuaregi TaxID=1816695 RepID=UPI0008F8013B|nr:chorismate mutase [Bacillus tuaregi]